jgi:hypothetical protein
MACNPTVPSDAVPDRMRAAPITMERALVAVWGVGEVLSATATVKLWVPAAVGLPKRLPAALKLRPAGSEPDASDQV